MLCRQKSTFLEPKRPLMFYHLWWRMLRNWDFECQLQANWAVSHKQIKPAYIIVQNFGRKRCVFYFLLFKIFRLKPNAFSNVFRDFKQWQTLVIGWTDDTFTNPDIQLVLLHCLQKRPITIVATWFMSSDCKPNTSALTDTTTRQRSTSKVTIGSIE